MSGLASAVRSARRWIDDCERFVRDYTEGVKARDFHRLFDEDAVAAYDVLRRDQDRGPEPKDDVGRFFYRAKVVFLGLSYKLSPARRLLFLAALAAALFGLLGVGPDLLVAHRIWLLLSVVALAFLLTLELVDQIRVRDELEVARQLQADLLPARTPDLDGYSLAHAYRTANEVGGDYYDFLELDDGRFALMVGDASGHGMAAGLLMAIANASLRLAVDLDPRPVPVLTLLNRSLHRTGDTRAFMSLFYGLLEPSTGSLVYASAGHPFPLLRRADRGIEELGEGSLPLGIRPELELSAQIVALGAGDLLLMFSDGLPEAVDRKDRPFGYERIRDLLAEPGSAETVRDRVLHALDSHLEGHALADDFSLVVVLRES